MTVADRVFICRMLEKMERNKEYAVRLGIGNISTYNGKSVVGGADALERKGK